MIVLDEKKAEEIKKKLNGNGGNGKKKVKDEKKASCTHGLPSLADLESLNVDVDDEEELKKQAAERKAYAEKAGKLIVGARLRIRQLELAQRIGVLTPGQEAELKKLEVAEKVILRDCDGVLKGHILFSVFIEEIRTTKRECGLVSTLISAAVEMGRYRQLVLEEIEYFRKNGWPENTLFGFNSGEVYVLSQNTPANRALATELYKAVKETKAVEEAYEAERMKHLLAAGDHDLLKFASGIAGTYVLQFLPNGKKYKEGVGVIAIEEQKFDGKSTWSIFVKDGAGSLEWLQGYKGKWMSFRWFIADISEKISPEVRLFADRFKRTLVTAVTLYKNRVQREAAEKKGK